MTMDKLFNPKSVAVIGASSKKGKVGYSVINNLIKDGYKGKIYPINPKSDEILNHKAYKSVKDVPDGIDLAVIIIPGKYVAGALRECGEKQIKYVIVISAGFKEVGHEGAMMEDELVKICKEYGIKMLGPNCLGLTSVTKDSVLNATFASRAPLKGSIAFASQSGAMLTSILDWSITEGIGFSKFISLGNKAVLNETDVLEALADDPDTRVILFYLESIVEGERFLKVAKKVTRKKPVVILKSGTSTAGAKAAASHTGALAGGDIAYEKAFAQTGVLRAKTMEELFGYALALSTQPIPEGKNVAIITNAGGPGIVCTDAVEHSGLKIASFDKGTIEKLKEGLPAEAAVLNPVDVIGDAGADRYELALKYCLNDANVHMAIVLMSPQAQTQFSETAEVMINFKNQFGDRKPLVAALMGGESVRESTSHLMQVGIPTYPFPESAVQALRGLTLFNDYRKKMLVDEKSPIFKEIKKKRVKEIFNKVKEDGRLVLLEPESIQVAEAYGIPVPLTRLANTPEQAVKLANEIGYPVVMKIASPNILHKSDIGGVKVGIKTDDEVRNWFRNIIRNAVVAVPDAKIYGVEVQQMSQIPNHKEIIIGMNRDPQFGALLMCGFGGIYVNFLQDVAFRLNMNGITKTEALEMVAETKVYSLLKGARGEAPSDIDSLIDAICRIGKLCADFKNEINELDINPIFVFERGKEPGCLALDVKITLNV
ncbi:MAG: acetate--CoA ligase alpha subunit [Candidatus Helarchaeota archaeon]